MRVLFRTDASVDIGSGHLTRCLTLAERLRVEGAEVAFVCGDLPGGMFELLQSRGYPCERLPLANAVGVDHQCVDAQETIRAAMRLFAAGLDWIVVDHYQLDVMWERKLRPHTSKLMVIDDIANRQHDCDLLLDQNYESPARYHSLVTENCRLLLGPQFALLRPEYAAYRKLMTRRHDDALRALVFFGGTDEHNLTGLSLKALSQPELRHLTVDLVVGTNYKYLDELGAQAEERPNTFIHGPRPHLADLMSQADLAIGAGGVTNWERMCLGLPSFVITIAENQVPISRILDREGAIKLVGNSKEVTAEDLLRAITDEIQSNRHLKLVEPAMKQCDGLGASRVSDSLLAFQ